MLDPIPLDDSREVPWHPPSTIVLYEPIETHVYGYSAPDSSPSKIEKRIIGVVDEIWNSTQPTRAAPVIEVLVMGMKKFKNSGFCLPCPRNLEPWGIIERVRRYA
jgi:hypothetical protein